MGNIAIIPARGGSKRIPRKNIKDFLGKPIIAYSIEAAVNSGLFDEVMVSTDDAEIAEVAKKYGAKVPFMRSAKNAGDYATLSEVLEEVEKEYASLGKQFDFTCCILPTTPLLTAGLLKNALKKIKMHSGDSIRPIVRFSYPVQRCFRFNGQSVELMYPEYSTSRSQDLEPAYHDAGMFYFSRYGTHLKGPVRLGIEISEMECQDIDSEFDWEMAELKYSRLHNVK